MEVGIVFARSCSIEQIKKKCIYDMYTFERLSFLRSKDLYTKIIVSAISTIFEIIPKMELYLFLHFVRANPYKKSSQWGDMELPLLNQSHIAKREGEALLCEASNALIPGLFHIHCCV